MSAGLACVISLRGAGDVGRPCGIAGVFLSLGLSEAGLFHFLEVDHPPGFSQFHGHGVYGCSLCGGFAHLFGWDGPRVGVPVEARPGLLHVDVGGCLLSFSDGVQAHGAVVGARGDVGLRGPPGL